jgi:hypothetical protein
MDTAIAAIHAVLKGQLPDVAPALRPTAAARVRKAAAQPAAG